VLLEVNPPIPTLSALDLPQSDPGAPEPVLLSSEHRAVLIYELASPLTWGAGGAAVVRFEGVVAISFGPPNDEALEGHPLAPHGLKPYRAFEAAPSPWVAELERRNQVHPRHRPGHLAARRHIILTFHDSVFECVASAFTATTDQRDRPDLVAAAVRWICTDSA
jgi:hypothetical protein